MDKETKLILDTLKMIQEVQRLMADVQVDHTEEIEVLTAKITKNKADLKAFKENGFSWA